MAEAFSTQAGASGQPSIADAFKDFLANLALDNEETISSAHAELRSLEEKYRAASLSKQIAFSGWYAHYKFFAEQQIDWIDEQRHFTWRDKVPLSARVAGALLIVLLIVGAVLWLV